MGNEKKNKEVSVSGRRVIIRSVIAFTVFIILMLAAWKAWDWLYTRPQEGRMQEPLRRMAESNEKLFTMNANSPAMARTYPRSRAAKKVRVNGKIGMGKDFDASNWKLKLVKSPGDTLLISLEEIKKLPKTNIVFDLKCIEGWSQITSWSGVSFSTFMKHYGLERQASMKYIGLNTPDGKYYVGIDMVSALHPQTMLCYELNDKPLPMAHGYPLRLIIPVKYGIKNLKRIGTLWFSDAPPPDYWAERGYDYYSGL